MNQVAYGYSVFCDLFTYKEWEGFSYTIDIEFNGASGFQSPTGVCTFPPTRLATVLVNEILTWTLLSQRAVGLGYQQEVIARLKNETLSYSHSQINVTLDSSTDTFPLNQSLYLDFSHDTNMISVLAAFGLRQFAQFLDPKRHPGPHNFTASHLTPFGARFDIEVIRTPLPLSPNREEYQEGKETKYVHFMVNQRTVPLGVSLPDCDVSRVDGWCELDTFVRVQEGMTKLANFDKACFGEYNSVGYGLVVDGAPH